MQTMLNKLRKSLQLLHKNKFTDIYNQQVKARNELLHVQEMLNQDTGNEELLQKEVITRQHYANINNSSLSLIKQQSKAEWIAYRDECSRFFMAKIKQKEGNEQHIHFAGSQ